MNSLRLINETPLRDGVPENILDAKTREELREWLSLHHSSERECYVRCSRGSPPKDGSLWYVDVVEEAICFGWIDSTLKPINGEPYNRLSPRRRNSHWSELNKERARRMESLGLMTDAGRAALPDMTTDIEVLFPDIVAILRQNPDVWHNMRGFPEAYVRIRLDGIEWERRNHPENNSNPRLEKFIEETRKGRMYGAWNDCGRLG